MNSHPTDSLPPEKKYAFFSKKMYQRCSELMYFSGLGEKYVVQPSCLYLDVNGNEVEVTGIDNNYECSFYKWDDKVLLGEVVEYVGPCRK